MMSTESDESEVRYLHTAWMRTSVVGIWQGWGMNVVLEGKTVREKVATPYCQLMQINLRVHALNLDVLKKYKAFH